ncbi:MFS transporter [uncultured Devosia sp.]|uniref:MFS transporter n=1 Tax=uncultured Devosia sp. TaxID=211434 RepID=UPI0035C94C0D
MSAALARWASPELRASVFHFTVFGAGGVASVYLGIWLSQKGIVPDQIGLISAVPVFGLLLLNLYIGRLADKAGDWRTVILILSLLGAAFPIGLFFVDEFWGILLVWAFCTLSAGAIPPVIDAATVRLTQRNGTDFGFVRAWGTIGYVVAAAGTGLVVTLWGPRGFVPLFFALSLLRALAALQLPRFRAPAQAVTLASVAARPGASRLGEVLKPWFVLPLLGFALVNFSHSVIGSFSALLWHNDGVPDYFIGPLLATSAGAEAAMMFIWRRVGGRFTARNMILVAGMTAVVRYAIMAFSPPVPVLFAIQLLHALTFGVGYFGVVHFIANWTREEIAAEAQGFANVLQQAIAVVGLMGFGLLVSHFGTRSFLACSIAGALAMACVLGSLALRSPKEAH